MARSRDGECGEKRCLARSVCTEEHGDRSRRERNDGRWWLLLLVRLFFFFARGPRGRSLFIDDIFNVIFRGDILCKPQNNITERPNVVKVHAQKPHLGASRAYPRKPTFSASSYGAA